MMRLFKSRILRQPRVFFITSYGRTATSWLASVLNNHPDIYCTHGSTLRRFPPGQERGQQRFRSAEEINSEQGQFYSLSLREIIEGMQAKHPASKLYGNIHGFTAANLRKQLKANRFPYSYQHVNLVRHPFTRIESFTRKWTKQSSANPVFHDHLESLIMQHPYCQSMIKRAKALYDVDFTDISKRLFLYAIVQQNIDFPDSQTKCINVHFERLIHDAEYFIWLFHLLTQEKLTINSSLINIYRTYQRTDSTLAKAISSYELVMDWEPWKIYLVREWLKDNPQLRRVYTKLKYDFNWISDVKC